MVDQACDSATTAELTGASLSTAKSILPLSVSGSSSTKVDDMPDDISFKPTLPTSTDSAPVISLVDLPAEIVQHIAGYLWIKKEYATWYDQIEDFRYYVEQETRIKGRKEVLTLSSCSKDLRQLLFRDSMLKEVTVKLEEKELSELASVPDECRRNIYRLIVKPGNSTRAKTEGVSFKDFISLLPCLKAAYLYCNTEPGRFAASDHSSLNDKDSMDQNQGLSKETTTRIPSTLTELRIRAEFYKLYDEVSHGTDAKELLLETMLRASVQLSQLETLFLSISAPHFLDAADRDSYLPKLIKVCNRSHLAQLKNVSFEIDADFDGSTKDIDTLAIFPQIYRTLWPSNKFDCLDVCLSFIGHNFPPDLHFDPWAKPLIKYGPAFLCPASPPLPSRLMDLATKNKDVSGLNSFSFSTRCSLGCDPFEGPIGVAEWQLEYPATAQPGLTPEGDATMNNQALVSTMSLGADAQDAITLTVSNRHPQSACCWMIRAAELDSVGESAWKARTEAMEGDGRDIPENNPYASDYAYGSDNSDDLDRSDGSDGSDRSDGSM